MKKILIFVVCVAVVLIGPVRLTISTVKSLKAGFFAEEPEGRKISQSVVALDDNTDLISGLYQSPLSRQRVIDFFTRFTHDPHLTTLILEQAVKRNIPPSLAFAVCYKESGFYIRAVNYNSSSVDRGLFQLNNTSFPHLVEADFFDPETNISQGLGYLRFCLDNTQDTALALAWYNCGPGQASIEIPAMTREYMRLVLGAQKQFEQIFRQMIVDQETNVVTRKLEKSRFVYLTQEPGLTSVGPWLLY